MRLRTRIEWRGGVGELTTEILGVGDLWLARQRQRARTYWRLEERHERRMWWATVIFGAMLALFVLRIILFPLPK